MSHFVMIVIGEDVEALLEPYSEHADAETAKEWHFENCTGEVMEEWDNGDIECSVINGIPYSQWSHKTQVAEKYGIDRDAFEAMPTVKVPHQEFAKAHDMNIVEWADYYGGWTLDDDEYGDELRFGYYYNPFGKWDWYVVGGRWTGYFKPKPGKGKLGESGVFGNKPKKGYVDQIRKGDLDLDGMFAEARADAENTYDLVEEALAVAGIPPRWSDIRDMWPIEAARKIYHDNKAVRAFNEKKLSHFMGEVVDDYYLKSGGREQYVRDAECRCLLPFGVLSEEHGWCERGEMGSFGFSMNDKGKYDWYSEFMQMWEELPDDTLITAVDCHV